MRYTEEILIGEHKLYIDYTQYTNSDTRIEECHGYHTFEDIRVKNVIDKITININDFEIDITDRLTLLEIEQISENL